MPVLINLTPIFHNLFKKSHEPFSGFRSQMGWYLMESMYVIVASIAVGLIAIIYAGILAAGIKRKPEGTIKVKEISDAIHEGSMAFLNKEYQILIVFMALVSALLYFLGLSGRLESGTELAISFIAGGFLSALAGNIGMRIATKANSRTAVAAKESLNKGLAIAFSSGAVMGLSVVGLGLSGVAALYLILGDPNVIFGFGFGASSIALFARVGGGIFTKAADVGADLVGKVEKGIPEDDPRNPAVIADNVGDNVGDVAGMGADLFESYVDSLIATMVIGMTALYIPSKIDDGRVILPLALAALGIVCSIIGSFFVRVGKDGNPSRALNRGIFSSAILMAISSLFLIGLFTNEISVYYATITGLAAGVIIGLATEYYTSAHFGPTKRIAAASETGSATNIIEGMGQGMYSTIVPVITVCAAIYLSYEFAGLYGISIAAVGMLSTLGITLASDTYGPVADNAAGIAEMAKMGQTTRQRAEALDSVGNTTAAIGKGFAIGSAALTALALFASFKLVVKSLTNQDVVIDITEPVVIIGLFIGSVLPFVFSALTMGAVGKAAFKIVNEVRRQFSEIKGIMTGEEKPDYKKCISISTSSALRHMILPGLIAVTVPIAVGIWLGVSSLGGLLAGVTVTGFLLAVFMANSGGAWDNAKKHIEEGNFGGKGSFAHKAAVVGDTVGDPFKDTAGPSLNILIKLVSIVSLVFVPLFL